MQATSVPALAAVLTTARSDTVTATDRANTVLNELRRSAKIFRGWRHHLHSIPEIAFHEHDTAAFVADRLREFGVSVAEGIAQTGVVGTLTHGTGPTIGLRAELDALPIEENTGLAYSSVRPGLMHACGHDGHMTMLLAAAEHLARTKNFAGTVRFIFQPAEESEGGAARMIDAGVLAEYPVDAMYAIHNRPGLRAGAFALRSGPMMASFDTFEVRIVGAGTHAAQPHLGVDTILASAQIVVMLNSIVSRSIAPTDSGVVSVTRIDGGTTWNVLPSRVVLGGTVRTHRAEVRDRIESTISRMCAGLALAHDVEVEVDYSRRYPVLVNSEPEMQHCLASAAILVGAKEVETQLPATMGAEDFAFFLERVPGNLTLLGNGDVDGGRILHSPRYDFNDDVLPLGAAFWITLTEDRLPASGGLA